MMHLLAATTHLMIPRSRLISSPPTSNSLLLLSHQGLEKAVLFLDLRPFWTTRHRLVTLLHKDLESCETLSRLVGGAQALKMDVDPLLAALLVVHRLVARRIERSSG